MISFLEQCLRDDIVYKLLPPNYDSSCNRLTLVEPQNESKPGKLAEVSIDEVPSSVLVLIGDKTKDYPLFKDEKAKYFGIYRKCDYLILMENYVLFIELKSSEEDVLTKFKAATCMFSYLQAVAKYFGNQTTCHYEHKYILLYNTPHKQPTRQSSVKEETSDIFEVYTQNLAFIPTISISDLIK